MAFVTRAEDLNPRSALAGADALAWTIVEINLIKAQFFLDIGPTSSSLADAWITSSVDALVAALGKLKAKIPAPQVHVLLLSPKGLNGKDGWRLEALSEVWRRQVPNSMGFEYRYVLSDGASYEDVLGKRRGTTKDEHGPWERMY